jgi:hypothetical protein
MPRVLFEKKCHIGKHPAILRAQRLAMTRKTKALLGFGEQAGHHAAMPDVAGIAGLFFRQRAVNERGGLDERFDVVMLVAGVAKARCTLP